MARGWWSSLTRSPADHSERLVCAGCEVQGEIAEHPEVLKVCRFEQDHQFGPLVANVAVSLDTLQREESSESQALPLHFLAYVDASHSMLLLKRDDARQRLSDLAAIPGTRSSSATS